MDFKIQILVAGIIIISIIVIANMVRKKALELKYALSWFVAGFFLFLFVIFPDLMEGLASVMGIAVPANMIFFFGFCFLIMILFTLTVALSRMAGRVKRLAQAVALLEKELEEKELLRAE